MEIEVFEEFISDDDASTLLAFTQERERFEYFAPDHRYRYVNKVESPVIELVYKYGAKFQELVQPEEPTDISDYILSIYEVGAFMNVHSDNSNLSHGNCNFTGVIYLNDGYEGGEICFPKNDVIIKPKRLSAVAFNGNYHHAVNPVLSGVRYILGIGFTDSPEFFKGGKSRKYLL